MNNVLPRVVTERLRHEVDGETHVDLFARGRYSTDASIYQIMPLGVVVPRSTRDAVAAVQIAIEAQVPVLARGAGSSQCGQAVGEALIIDNSKYLNRIIAFDAAKGSVTVEPGVVLDQLNAFLKPHGLFFPVDVSTSAQATIGGMAGNNSCGARSIRYGNMVHNVRAISACLADGRKFLFGDTPADLEGFDAAPAYLELVKKMRAIRRREAEEIERRIPRLLRKVGGYNLDAVHDSGHNMASLLVGSEGTLAYSTGITLGLQPIPAHKILGVCHFASFRKAMECTRHIVQLEPSAVELVDRTMIELARDIPAFRDIIGRFLVGEPDALLLVEFAGDDKDRQFRGLKRLSELMGELGIPGSVVDAVEPSLQRDIWEIRKAGLNIMMSMKGDGKPVSFIEDCAVPLENLAAYTERLTEIFEKHGTRGTWYAHASVGCLHVRPVLNMKQDGAKKMRAIAEEAAALVREYKGSYSGEHGDGLVRSEWIEPMFGPRLTRAFEEIKDIFDPKGLLNPGKIVRPPKMDDAGLFRFKPGYKIEKIDSALDWSQWGGFGAAVEMCNNNGACRKRDAGVMCPSYLATGDEAHLTRGRANTLRLAISGQLGPDAFVSDAMRATLDLCVSCKGCKRECPTGVDMAKMKIEFLHHYHQRHGYALRDRLIANLPRYAPLACEFSGLANLRDQVPGLALLSEKLLGLSRKRSLPRWRRDAFRQTESADAGPLNGSRGQNRDVVLFVDTFNRYFEPENARAALAVLKAADYRVHLPSAGARPLCCGRSFLAAGMVADAKKELGRVLAALQPYAAQAIPIVGLEPACLLTLRDELTTLLPGESSELLAAHAMLFEEFLAREKHAGKVRLALKPLPQKRALLHGHCHQKAFGLMAMVEEILAWIPELEVETIESSCCGMAGAFGYEAEHYGMSMKMAELKLLPKIRSAPPDTLLVADGTSCRHQIADGTGRAAVHSARALECALEFTA